MAESQSKKAANEAKKAAAAAAREAAKALNALYEPLRESLKAKQVLSRATKAEPERQFLCSATGIKCEHGYGVASGKTKKNGEPELIGRFIHLPAAKRHILAVYQDNADAAREILERLCEQYKQNRIIDCPPLMEIAANNDLALAGDLDVWTSVPGFQTVEQYLASKPVRKPKEPAAEGEGEEPVKRKRKASDEGGKKKKAKAPVVEVPQKTSAFLRDTKNAEKALSMGEPATEEKEAVELKPSAINAKRATMAKQEGFTHVELEGGGYLEFVAVSEGKKPNPWYPAAQGYVIVCTGSRRQRFTLAGEAPAEEEKDEQ